MTDKSNKKILIVDDEQDIVQVINVQLKGSGYLTCVAHDGKEALQKVFSEKPDLIILDIIMPLLDGFGVYKALRSQKETANIPIIILTARGKMEDSLKVLGVDEFIAKPFDMSRLMAAVDRLLNRGAKASSAPAPSAPPTAGGDILSSVLIAGHPSEPLDKCIAYLKTKKIEAFVVQSESDLLSKGAVIKPKAVMLDAYFNDSSAEDTVKALRRSEYFSKIPIILYSYIDNESLGGDSLSERLMSIETAKDNCLAAGATTFAGQLTDKGFANMVFVSIQ